MKKEEEVDVNKVNYGVYASLVRAILEEYSVSFNQVNPTRKIDFTLTITPATVSTHDALLRSGQYKTKEEILAANIKDDKIEARYMRLAKAFINIKYHTPILEEFKPGFTYQRLNIVDKVWDEEKFEDGDVILEADLEKEHIRVATDSKQQEVIIHQQSIRLKDQKEVLNDKWWKRILFLDLLNTLIAKGIEYGEALTLIKRGEEEKAVLANELGESAKQVLEANKIVIRKEMPAPLTPEDKKYAAEMKVAKEKDSKK